MRKMKRKERVMRTRMKMMMSWVEEQNVLLMMMMTTTKMMRMMLTPRSRRRTMTIKDCFVLLSRCRRLRFNTTVGDWHKGLKCIKHGHFQVRHPCQPTDPNSKFSRGQTTTQISHIHNEIYKTRICLYFYLHFIFLYIL